MKAEETLQSFMDVYEKEGRAAIINDGKLIGFEQEEIPTQTTNPSGDNK